MTLEARLPGATKRRGIRLFLTATLLGLVVCGFLLIGPSRVAASQSASDAFNRAVAAFARHDYKAAVTDFNDALAPGGLADAQTYYDRGLTYFMLGRYAPADSDISEALKRRANGDETLAPSFARQAYRNRGVSRIFLQKWSDAKTDLQMAVKWFPRDWVVFNDLAFAQANLGDDKGALTNYDRALVFDPKNAVVHDNRGIAYYELGRYALAENDMSEVIAGFADGDKTSLPAFARWARFYRGTARDFLGKWSDAKADLMAAVTWFPQDWRSWDNLGWARANLGDDKGAVAAYDRAVQNDPKNGQLFYNRGLSLFRLGAERRAIADFTSAISLQSNQGSAYQYRGRAYSSLADYRRADADYSMAIRLIPKADSWEYRCEARMFLGRGQEALADCNHALADYPRWALAYVARAWVKATLRDNQGALRDDNSAVKLAPRYAAAYESRGWVRTRLAEYRAAFVDYNWALHLSPGYTLALNDRAALAKFIGYAKKSGVRGYGIPSIDIAKMEFANFPSQSEYQQRVDECGHVYSQSDSYFDDCVENGVEEARTDEASDHAAEQQAAEVGYNVEQQVQEDANYEAAQEEAQQAATQEGESNVSGGGGDDGGGANEGGNEGGGEGSVGEGGGGDEGGGGGDEGGG